MKVSESSSKPTRDLRLDLLKAIAISFVLYLHFQPILFSGSTQLNRSIPWIVSRSVWVFSNQFTMGAVPLFIIVSLFLGYRKLTKNIDYLKKRAVRLLKLFCFWAIVQTGIYLIVVAAIASQNLNTQIPAWNQLTVLWLGGPSLPLVGDSVLYFLMVSIVLSALLWLYENYIPDALKNPLSIALVILFVIYFQTSKRLDYQIPYWRLDNFLIYITIVYLLIHKTEKIVRLKYLFLFLYIAISLQDLILMKQGNTLNIYGRSSMLWMALTLFGFVYSFNLQNLPAIARFLSKYSLGIFATHKYWQLAFWSGANYLHAEYNVTKFIPLFNGDFNLLRLGYTSLAVVFTCLGVRFLAATPLKKFVS